MNRRPGQNRNRRSDPPLYVDIDVRTERRSKSTGERVATLRNDTASPSPVAGTSDSKTIISDIAKRHADAASGWIIVRHTDGSIAVDRLGRYGDDVTVIDRIEGVAVRYPDSGNEHPIAFVARVLGLDTRAVAEALKGAGWERQDYDGGWTDSAAGEPWTLDGADYEAADAAFRRIGGVSTSGKDGVLLNSPSNTFDRDAAHSRSQYADLKATYRTRTNEENRRFGEAIMARADSQRIVGRAGKTDRRGTSRTVSGTREQTNGKHTASSSQTSQRHDPAEVERDAFTTATGWVVVLRTSGQVIVDRRTSSGNDVTVVDTVRDETKTFVFSGSGSRTTFIARVLGLRKGAVNSGLAGAGWSWNREDDTWANSRSDTAWIPMGADYQTILSAFDSPPTTAPHGRDNESAQDAIGADVNIAGESEITFIWPADGTVTSEFGMRYPPEGGETLEMHNGIDIANDEGTPIVAVADGTVIHLSQDASGGFGYYILIDHGFILIDRDKQIYSEVSTLYAHLKEQSHLGIKAEVSKGQEIGKMGSTGRSTGPHLHFEIRDRTVRRNPRDYLPVAGAPPVASPKPATMTQESSLSEVGWLLERSRTGVITLDGRAGYNRNLVIGDGITLRSTTIHYPGGSTRKFLGESMGLDPELVNHKLGNEAGWTYRGNGTWSKNESYGPWTLTGNEYDTVNALFERLFQSINVTSQETVENPTRRGERHSFVRMSQSARGLQMQDIEWTGRSVRGAFTIGESGCFIIAAVKIIRTLTGKPFDPAGMIEYTDGAGELNIGRITRALQEEAASGRTAVTDWWENQLDIPKIVEVARSSPPKAVIGRINYGTGRHFAVLEGFTIDPDGADVTFQIDGTSENDARRTYRLVENDPEKNVFAVNMILTFALS